MHPIEQILEDDGFCVRALTWEQLGYKADFGVCGATIRRYVGTLENCWQAPKELLRKTPHWDDTTIRAIIDDGWERVSFPFINKRVNIIPARLQAVIECQGGY